MKHFDHHSGQHLDVDGARIYVERIGEPDRPCLVLLHGGIGTLADFNPALPALCDDFQLLGIDSRGRGRSTLGRGGLSYQRMQRDVEEVLRQLRIERPSVLGFSDGGIVGYRLAAAGVARIARLATIGATWHSRHIEPVKDIFAKVTAGSWREKFPDSVDTSRSTPSRISSAW